MAWSKADPISRPEIFATPFSERVWSIRSAMNSCTITVPKRHLINEPFVGEIMSVIRS